MSKRGQEGLCKIPSLFDTDLNDWCHRGDKEEYVIFPLHLTLMISAIEGTRRIGEIPSPFDADLYDRCHRQDKE